MDLEYLQANIAYDPDTGLFTRKKRVVGGQGVKEAGSLVGHKQENGYLTTHARGKQVRLHRLAFYYMTGKMPGDDQQVDHINGVRDDNRWGNLRLATQQENAMNMKLRSDNKSGARGVSYCNTNKKWTVKLKHKGVMHCFGSYADKDEAISVRMAAQSILQGDWARNDLDDKAQVG